MADFWLQFAITILKGVLAGFHIDPTKLPGLQNVLLGIANDIYVLYNLTPPVPPATPVVVGASSTVPAPK